MSIVSAIVLFAVIWFLVLFIVLPIRLVTQADRGEIVPGTHAGAPANPQMVRKAKITTLVSIVIWVVVAGTILSGAITLEDLDWSGRLEVPGGETGE